MQIIYGMENYQPGDQDLFLALGNFDGIHKGHQSLINNAIARSKQFGGIAGAFIFDPHPTQVLFPERMPLLLVNPIRKAALLEKMGLDLLIYETFTRDIAAITPEEFVFDVLLKSLKIKEVFVGFNHTFGYKGRGTPELLQKLGEENGFKVHITPPVKVDDEIVSSSLVRQALEEGRIEWAARMLGYHPVLDGVVIEGEKRGRQLGFPTANVGIESIYNVPAKGVYAAKARVLDQVYNAVVNIGSKPTFHKEYPLSIEAYLMDFDKDIYGQPISLSFIKRLRNEQKFASLEDLIAQINKDRDQAYDIAKNHDWEL